MLRTFFTTLFRNFMKMMNIYDLRLNEKQKHEKMSANA